MTDAVTAYEPAEEEDEDELSVHDLTAQDLAFYSRLVRPENHGKIKRLATMHKRLPELVPAAMHTPATTRSLAVRRLFRRAVKQRTRRPAWLALLLYRLALDAMTQNSTTSTIELGGFSIEDRPYGDWVTQIRVHFSGCAFNETDDHVPPLDETDIAWLKRQDYGRLDEDTEVEIDASISIMEEAFVRLVENRYDQITFMNQVVAGAVATSASRFYRETYPVIHPLNGRLAVVEVIVRPRDLWDDAKAAFKQFFQGFACALTGARLLRTTEETVEAIESNDKITSLTFSGTGRMLQRVTGEARTNHERRRAA